MKSMQTKNWDRDKVWDNIEKELRKKKKRRGILWFWTGAGSLLVALLLWLGPGLGNRSIYNPSSTTQSANTEITEAQHTSSTSPSPTPIQSEASLSSSELIPPDFDPQIPDRGFKRATTLSNVFSSPTEQSSSSYISPNIIQSDSLYALKNLFPNNKSSLDKLSSKALVIVEEFPTKRMNILLPLSRKEPDPLGWSRDLDVFPSMKTKAIPKSPTRNLRVATTFGTGNVQHTGSNIWTAAKAASETLEYVSTNTIGLDWYFSPKGYLFTGLSYQLIRSRYEFTSTQMEVVRSIESDSAIIYPLPSQNIYEPGVLQETRITRRSIIHNNVLHRFSIPAGIGFTQSIGRFQLETRIGIRLQFAQQFNGVSLNEVTMNHVLDNKQSNERYYPDYLSLGWTSSFLLNYPLKQENYLFVGFQYEQDGLLYFPAPTFQSDYRIWGLQLGWKKGF